MDHNPMKSFILASGFIMYYKEILLFMSACFSCFSSKNASFLK